MPENSAIDLATLNAESKCFNCWSKTEKMAATLWLMAEALKAITEDADHDFTNVNTFQEVIGCFRCVPDATLDSYLVAVFKQLAMNAGAIGNLSASEIRKQATCWFNLDPKSLKAGFAFMINEIISDTTGGPPDDD
jgi:hypothetical protein